MKPLSPEAKALLRVLPPEVLTARGQEEQLLLFGLDCRRCRGTGFAELRVLGDRHPIVCPDCDGTGKP